MGLMPSWWYDDATGSTSIDTGWMGGRQPFLSKTPGIYVPTGLLMLFDSNAALWLNEQVLIDTGAGVLALPGSYADPLGVTPDPAYRYGATLPDGRRVELRGALVSASLLGEPREFVPAYFHDAIEVPLLGLHLLMERFVITLDGETKQMTWRALPLRTPIPLVDAPDG